MQSGVLSVLLFLLLDLPWVADFPPSTLHPVILAVCVLLFPDSSDADKDVKSNEWSQIVAIFRQYLGNDDMQQCKWSLGSAAFTNVAGAN